MFSSLSRPLLFAHETHEREKESRARSVDDRRPIFRVFSVFRGLYFPGKVQGVRKSGWARREAVRCFGFLRGAMKRRPQVAGTSGSGDRPGKAL